LRTAVELSAAEYAQQLEFHRRLDPRGLRSGSPGLAPPPRPALGPLRLLGKLPELVDYLLAGSDPEQAYRTLDRTTDAALLAAVHSDYTPHGALALLQVAVAGRPESTRHSLAALAGELASTGALELFVAAGLVVAGTAAIAPGAPLLLTLFGGFAVALGAAGLFLVVIQQLMRMTGATTIEQDDALLGAIRLHLKLSPGGLVGGAVGAFAEGTQEGFERGADIGNLAELVGWTGSAMFVARTARAGKVVGAGTIRASGRRSAPPGSKGTGSGVSVIGHVEDGYVKLADGLGANRFHIPDAEWNAMSRAERWAANQKFLDDAIARDDTFHLATPLDKVRPGSMFQSEINYLAEHGYRVSGDGGGLVPPGGR